MTRHNEKRDRIIRMIWRIADRGKRIRNSPAPWLGAAGGYRLRRQDLADQFGLSVSTIGRILSS